MSALLSVVTGCYGSRESVTPPDAFSRPDAGTDARRRDAAREPDAFAPDTFVPDAFLGPDAWLPELGWDCSLGGTQDAFEVIGGRADVVRWREDPLDWFMVEVSAVDDADEPDRGILRPLLSLRSARDRGFFMFEAPDGSPFRPQVFPTAQNAPFADWGHAGVTVFWDPCGDNTSRYGSLTIHEVSVVEGQLRRLRASFTHGCGGGMLAGCIRYTAP